MSGQIIGPIGVLPTGGGPSIPLALDTTPGSGAGFLNTNAVASSVTSATFTTGAVNEIIVVAVTTNASPQGNSAVTSVTGSGLTFVRVPSLTAPIGGSSTIDIWWALASSIFSNTITVNVSSSAFTTSSIFAVVGANLVTPWDVFGPTTSTTTTVAHVTSTSTNVFGIGALVNGGILGPNAGWSTLTTGGFCCICTRIKTAAAFSNEAFDSADDGIATGSSIGVCLQGS